MYFDLHSAYQEIIKCIACHVINTLDSYVFNLFKIFSLNSTDFAPYISLAIVSILSCNGIFKSYKNLCFKTKI